MKKIDVVLETLTCPSCIKKIENHLSREKGVLNPKVYFHSSKVKASFDDNIINEDKIVSGIKSLGFEVISFEVYN